jgi:hypothetical protein
MKTREAAPVKTPHGTRAVVQSATLERRPVPRDLSRREVGRDRVRRRRGNAPGCRDRQEEVALEAASESTANVRLYNFSDAVK